MTTPDRRPHRRPAQQPVVIDGGDRACIGLLLELRTHIAGLPAGTLIHLIASDPAAPIDLPAWCHLTGHAYLGPLRATRTPTYAMRSPAQRVEDPLAVRLAEPVAQLVEDQQAAYGIFVGQQGGQYELAEHSGIAQSEINRARPQEPDHRHLQSARDGHAARRPYDLGRRPRAQGGASVIFDRQGLAGLLIRPAVSR